VFPPPRSNPSIRLERTLRMQRRTHAAFAAALVLCAARADDGTAGPKRREISILYNVNNGGYVEPCG